MGLPSAAFATSRVGTRKWPEAVCEAVRFGEKSSVKGNVRVQIKLKDGDMTEIARENAEGFVRAV